MVDDLVWYVIDIDIYYIDFDKLEYNCGLFWYMDYYLFVEMVMYRIYLKYYIGNVY